MTVRSGRRQQRRLRVEGRFGDLVTTLAEMNGFPADATLREGKGPFTPGAMDQLRRRVDQFGNPPPNVRCSNGTLEEHDFFEELLGSHGDYASESCAMVSLDISLLALPGASEDPVPAFDNVSVSGSPAVESFVETFALPSAEGRRRREISGVVRPYLDPALRGSRVQYGRFIARLVACGLVELREQPGSCEVGAFAVRKKDSEKQRLVIDARWANCHFRQPPRARLPSGSALASVRSSASGFYCSCTDVKDFFYHLLLPERLRGLFHLPEIRREVLVGLGVPGVVGRGCSRLFPRLRVVPMGWNHALDIAQNFFEGVVSQALSVPRTHLLHDGSMAPSLQKGVAGVYVDNFLFLSRSREEAVEAVNKVLVECSRVGLPTHGVRRVFAA